jgi:ATP-dependent DNA ligase
MSQGFEGAILKDWDTPFVDGTSKMQLKLKLEIDLEVRLVGFQPGTKGSKREGKIGSLIFENDEKTIKGRASGFSDKELDDFTLRQDELLGKIMTVQFNDLTKAQGNNFYALSHPRFITFRDDKNETDTLETAFKLREMAIQLKN